MAEGSPTCERLRTGAVVGRMLSSSLREGALESSPNWNMIESDADSMMLLFQLRRL
jgi:hypothetical protein